MSHSTFSSFSSLRVRALGVALAAVALTATGCVHDPVMRLNHAEISGIRIGFPGIPPTVGVQMTVFLDVYNPNSYDVAVRAVRGQVVFAGKYPLPVDFRANQQGIWLPAGRYTSVRVPVTIPMQLGIALMQESYNSPVIPYVFNG